MVHGSIRKVFPGGNTSLGFYSFYHHIIDPKDAKIFILKGGPGVGKSTLIENIGLKMTKKGYNIEFHCCSSDNGSYDGVVIPQLKVALIDGTAPHIVDPKYPGAVDEIINLGAFWNETGLIAAKKEIIKLSKEISRQFHRCYSYLAQAKLLNDEIEKYYLDCNCLNFTTLNQDANWLIKEVLDVNHPPRIAKDRHLFASAITPQGLTNHLDTLFDSFEKRYIITGPAGTGKATMVKKLYEAALNLGFEVEVFHCALNPTQIEHLILPEIKTGIITSSGPHTYQARPGDQIVNTGRSINTEAIQMYHSDLSEAARRFDAALKRGVGFLAKAKSLHDELEQYYVNNMDFETLNEYREKLITRIELMA